MTHFVIDLLGDFVLAHDSYDDLAHDSRQTGAIALSLCLFATIGFGFRAALIEARGNAGALLSILRRAQPRDPWRYVIGLTVASLFLVVAMEWCDAAIAGRPCDDIVELFGGSLVLAVACASTVAALLTVALGAGLRRLTKLHRAIVAIVVAFICEKLALRPPDFVCRNRRRSSGKAGLLGSSSGGRAPPAVPSLANF